jgi:hypothetical protein
MQRRMAAPATIMTIIMRIDAHLKNHRTKADKGQPFFIEPGMTYRIAVLSYAAVFCEADHAYPR